MENVIRFIDGNKTYIVAVCIGIVAAASAAGLITTETKNTIDGILYPLIAVAMRHAIAKGK
jgi:hypothetical protein